MSKGSQILEDKHMRIEVLPNIIRSRFCFVLFDDRRLFDAADFLYAKRLSNGFQEATPLGSANRWFICTPSSNHRLFPQRIAYSKETNNKIVTRN